MLAVLLGTLRSSSRRYVATALAIVLGVGFATVTLVLSATLAGSIRDQIAGDVGRYAVVVVPGDDLAGNAVPAGVADAVRSVPGVTSVDAEATTSVQVRGAAQTLTLARTWRTTPGLRLVQGSAPRGDGQVVVSSSVATRASLRVGGPVTLDDGRESTRRLVVSGIAQQEGGDSGVGQVWGSASALVQWSGTRDLSQLLVTAAPGTDAAALRDRVDTAVQRVGHGDLPAPAVRTGTQQADVLTTAALRGSDAITLFLSAFAAVALFVSVLVITNTFAILVASRRRQVALLRCVGATRAQVLRTVVAESLVVGVVGSALGVGLGVGLAAVVSRVVGGSGPVPLQSLSVTATSVGVPLLAGVLVTLVAALLPARRATRVPPLAALRPDDAPEVGTRVGRRRLVVAGLLVAVGVAALVYGAATARIAVALPGGIVSAVGLLVGAVAVLPPVLRLLGVPARRLGGVPGDLAVENAVRNPARAAAAASALLVGVTLITMMSVAAASAQAGVLEGLDARFAVDAEVRAAPGSLTPAVVDRVAGTDGVAAAVALTSAPLVLGRGEPQDVVGVPSTTVGTVLRSTARSPYAAVRPGLVVVDDQLAPSLGLHEGSRTTLGALPVTVHLVREPPYPVLAVTTDLERAGAGPRTTALLVRLTDADDPGPTVDRLGHELSDVQGVDVGGAALQRAELEQIVSVVLLVVTGLLLVAVAIALVGVGNTLALSVLERQRESALLRALGLTRGQLRGSLALEGALLAAVAVVAGVAVGVGYGWAGARALLGAHVTVPLVVPWARLLLVALVALLAGVGAAWLPSRRAARVQPATALAQE